MAASSADSSRPARKGKILIVDDEEGMRDLLKAILESDYHVPRLTAARRCTGPWTRNSRTWCSWT